MISQQQVGGEVGSRWGEVTVRYQQLRPLLTGLVLPLELISLLHLI